MTYTERMLKEMDVIRKEIRKLKFQRPIFLMNHALEDRIRQLEDKADMIKWRIASVTGIRYK